jgi:photosystem II stability/assembly factor-like uncharacterized protein
VGALAIALSDPNVIYAGMGESTIRIDVSYGDGVYKTTDGGRSWQHMGLASTRHIGRIQVHPANPNLVYVAALGHAFGANKERGVYRSKDGGRKWEQVLFKSKRAGAVDISLDMANPQILYASIWQVYRNFWELNSGGPDSGLWRSTDGGDTWGDLSANKGFPQALKGKSGVAASPAKAGRVWCIIEAANGEGGLYRSDDYGDSWQRVSDMPELLCRPWYYAHIFADPQDPDTVYINNLGMWKSTDGGKSFTEIGTPHGDNHDLWIDPADNQRMIQSNDGGANISFNGGESFSTIYNQPTAQFYHMAVDNQFPYRVYGTQQDNSSIRVPSDTISGAITWADCSVAGTGESGYIAVDPLDDEIVYVGAVGSAPGGQGAFERCDQRSGQIQMINIWPEDLHGRGVGEAKYRFPWTYPILFSPHDPKALFACGNHVFRSTNEGHSWEVLSPDLTRADMSKLGASGGPITLDTSGAEHYGTISTFRESALEAGLFWAGSDDGLVHLSRDGGKSWKNVTPKDLPEWALVRTVEPSPFEPGVCYLCATRYKLDDTAPYLYKTTDFGKKWKRITAGLPDDDYTRVIRADPNRPGLLYCGTESGLYLSANDGDSWQRWQSTLPVSPIYDMLVKEKDLVIATHGRGFYIGDDLTVLYQGLDTPGFVAADDESPARAVTLFAPRPAWRIQPDLTAEWTTSEGKGYSIGMSSGATFFAEKTEDGQVKRTFFDAGEAAPRGAVITYYLPEAPADGIGVEIAILDRSGAVLRTYQRKRSGYAKLSDAEKSLDPGPWVPAQAGTNRFVWNLKLPGAVRVPGNKTAGEANEGPFVLPGDYLVRLTVTGLAGGDISQTHPLVVANDPRVKVAPRDLQTQQRLLLQIRDKVSDAHRGVLELRELRAQLEGWQKRMAAQPEVSERIAAVLAKLAEIEDPLFLPGDQRQTYGLIVRSRLNSRLASLIPVVGSADAKPTKAATELANLLMGEIDAQLAKLAAVIRKDVPAVNKLIRKTGIEYVAV